MKYYLIIILILVCNFTYGQTWHKNHMKDKFGDDLKNEILYLYPEIKGSSSSLRRNDNYENYYSISLDDYHVDMRLLDSDKYFIQHYWKKAIKYNISFKNEKEDVFSFNVDYYPNNYGLVIMNEEIVKDKYKLYKNDENYNSSIYDFMIWLFSNFKTIKCRIEGDGKGYVYALDNNPEIFIDLYNKMVENNRGETNEQDKNKQSN